MPKPYPPRKLIIQKLSTGEQVHSPALRDDFTNEPIPSQLPTLGELPNTHEIDASRPSQVEVNQAIVEELIRRGRVTKDNDLQRRGKLAFPRRDMSPQARAEQAMRDYQQGRGPRR